MANISKYSTNILRVIRHNIREFKDGECKSNKDVDPERSKDNYSLIRRGETAVEINNYRKKIEKECFKYNRKNLVHANEVICTLPKDCPPDQERRFFEESYNYILSTLPMGDRCIFLAEIHADEGTVKKDGVTVVQGAKHMHLMYIPAVPDTKHDGYDYRLCSDALTKHGILKRWHTNYQTWLDNAGVQATVKSGVTSKFGVSVKTMKEISKETGLSLQQFEDLKKENERLHHELDAAKQQIRTMEAATRQNTWGSTPTCGSREKEKEFER